MSGDWTNNSLGSDFETSQYPEARRKDEEFGELGKSDIPENIQGRWNAQEEFVHLLFNDIVEILLTKTEPPKSPEESSAANDGANENGESENEEWLEKEDKDLGPDSFDRKSFLHDEYVALKFPNKNSYTGRLSRGQMKGDGIYRWGSGETYKGQFAGNSIEGKGHFEWKDQSWYEGEFHKGHRHGTGNLVSNEYGRFYTGQWRMGRKHGTGYSRYNKAEDSYEGEWNMDEKHGTGYRIYKNGTRYIGQWEDDRRHGIGTMFWPNGDLYRGEWENGTMNGYGEYVWNGFLNESLSWPKENSYMGEWRNGMRHGGGVLKLNSIGGAKYSGNWYTDMKHGHGMIVGDSGAVTEADPLFLDNILTSYRLPERDSGSPATANREDVIERENPSRSAGGKTMVERKDPRKTTVFEPLQCPPLWFHVRRLMEGPKLIEKSSSGLVAPGKCHACSSESMCVCLYDPSGNPGRKSTGISDSNQSSFGVEWSGDFSDRFYTRVEESEVERIKRYEEHWVYNCLRTHMSRLRKVYKLYAELYCKKKEIRRDLSMGKIGLWQLMRDCDIAEKSGMSLVEFERCIAINKSAFIEGEFYPFERIEFFQFIHALLEVSWHLYTKLNDIETESMRGRLAGGLHRLLIKDIFPNAGKLVGNVSTTYRDLLPIYSVYQLYCDVGEPHTAKKFLRATCILKGIADPKPLPWSMPETTSIPSYLINGINAITVGERLSYIPSDKQLMESDSPELVRTCEDDLARELFALRHIGAPKMLSIMSKVCPVIRDRETDTIINMDYELTFLEFYEILLEATRVLIYAKKLSAKELEASKLAAETLIRSQTAKSSTHFKRSSLSNSKIKKKLA